MTSRWASRPCGRVPLAALAVLAGWIAGCHTPLPPVPVDLTQPGWNLRTGQAVWTPSPQDEPLSGDLLLAVRPGEFWLEFAKPPFSLVTARGTTNGWQFARPLRREQRSGTGAPPAEMPWFLLPRALAGQPLPPGWQFEARDAGGWRLTHPARGESLEGFLSP